MVLPTERTPTMSMRPRLVGALLGSLTAFGVAGVGFAGAQETPTTDPPAAEAPSTTPDDSAPDNVRPKDCDHGRGSSDSGTTGGDTTSL